MLDTPPPILPARMRFERVLEDVQRFPIGAVPNRVYAELESLLGSKLCRLLDVRYRIDIQPRAFRAVAVWLQ